MRVLIVEDDTSLLKYTTMLLNGDPGISVVGSYTTGEDALANMERLQPDILLLDIGLPGISGIDVIEKAKPLMPDMEIIVHTVFDDKKNVFQALKKGAVGYILKGCRPNELINAFYEIMEGGAPMSRQIARSVITGLQKKTGPPPSILTAREIQILELMDQDCKYAEIADTLCISPHTVHTHIKHIYEKLHAKNREEVFTKARKKGILY